MVDGDEICDEQQMAEEFNSFFSTVGTNLDQHISQSN